MKRSDRSKSGIAAWGWSAVILWVLTCVDGILEAALGSHAHAWVGLLLASVVVTVIGGWFVFIYLDGD